MIVLLAIASLTGCYATISTPSGLREHHRGLNGLVVTGKATPDSDDQYHQTQRATDRTSLELLREQLSQESGS